MKWAFLVLLIFTYANFTRAAIAFFKTPDESARKSKAIVSIVGSLSMVLQLFAAARATEVSGLQFALAFIAIFAALVIFLSTQATLRDQRLNFAFSSQHSAKIVRNGPFRWVRHPIYLSYSLCWLGGFAFAPGWASSFPLIVLLPFYLAAIIREERQFLSGPLGSEYAAYQKSTGRFMPRVW